MLVEEAFGWAKTIAGMAKVKVRGLACVRFKRLAQGVPAERNRPIDAAGHNKAMSPEASSEDTILT